jgi:flagellar motor switch/type III secretory pathway protein FliN
MSAMAELDGAELDGLVALRRVDPHDAALGAALAALIARDDVRVTISSDAAAGSWFRAGDADFAAGGQPLLRAGRIDDAVAVLDRIDPLLDHVEQALGIALDPDMMIAAPRDDGVIITIMSGTETIMLAVTRDHAQAPHWIDAAQGRHADPTTLPCPLRITLTGPRLSMADAGALDAGDLVMIAQAPHTALITPDGTVIPGQLALATGLFTHAPQGSPMAEAPTAPHDFAVPLSIRLPDRMTSAATLAALVPGATLPLGPLTDGMPVTLIVGDRDLARGELVQLGDRFAILIEARATIDDPVTPPPEAAPAASDEGAQ